MKLGLKRGVVKVVRYDPGWPKEFQKEKKRLKGLLGRTARVIEHVGSTSIPGMPAKPILDIQLAVASFQVVPGLRAVLERHGYIYRGSAFRGQRLFVKGPEARRTHHLHVMISNSKVWKKAILFRDYLIKDRASFDGYVQLKQGLARKFPSNRGSYTNGKTAFVKKVVRLASRKTVSARSPLLGSVYSAKAHKREVENGDK